MWLSHDLRSHDLMNGDLFNCLRFYKQTMRSRAQLIEHHFLRRLCEMFSHFSKYFVRCPLFQIQGNCWNSGEQHQWWTSGSNRWNRCPILLTAVLNQVPSLSNCVGFFCLCVQLTVHTTWRCLRFSGPVWWGAGQTKFTCHFCRIVSGNSHCSYTHDMPSSWMR